MGREGEKEGREREKERGVEGGKILPHVHLHVCKRYVVSNR